MKMFRLQIYGVYVKVLIEAQGRWNQKKHSGLD